MATKVEMLSNQLALAQERCNMLHKRSVKDGNTDEKYMVDFRYLFNCLFFKDTLKQRCETLEKQISDLKAFQIFNDQQQRPASEKPGVTMVEVSPHSKVHQLVQKSHEQCAFCAHSSNGYLLNPFR